MTIELVCIDTALSDRSKNMIRGKLNKIERFLTHEDNVRVTCRKKGLIYTIEAFIGLPKNQIVRAEASNRKIMTAVIDVQESMERQLRKKKEKKLSQKKIPPQVSVVTEAVC